MFSQGWSRARTCQHPYPATRHLHHLHQKSITHEQTGLEIWLLRHSLHIIKVPQVKKLQDAQVNSVRIYKEWEDHVHLLFNCLQWFPYCNRKMNTLFVIFTRIQDSFCCVSGTALTHSELALHNNLIRLLVRQSIRKYFWTKTQIFAESAEHRDILCTRCVDLPHSLSLFLTPFTVCRVCSSA